MAEIQDEKWLDDLDAQIEHASPDFLKAALEHTTKMLDHVYAANDAISQKARWAIGIIMGVMVMLLRETVAEAKLMPANHSQALPWVLYGIVLGILAICLILFFVITWIENQFHSGYDPKDIKWKTILEDAQADAKAMENPLNGKGLDLAYFISGTLFEYRKRIKDGRNLNDRIAFRFNSGLFLLLVALIWWIVSYTWLNS